MAGVLFIIFVALYIIVSFLYYTNYQKYRGVPTTDKTGYDAALEVLRTHNLDNYIIEQKGSFTDNYNCNKRVIKLSSLVFHDNNAYSVIMGYFIAYQAILDKENGPAFKIKKLLEPFYYVLITISYLVIIMLAFSDLDVLYPALLLGTCLLYQLVFIKPNIDIINAVKKEYKVDNSINMFYFIDMFLGVIYIKVLVDKLVELIKNR